jgi:RNase P/RNase MRP subunit POP5
MAFLHGRSTLLFLDQFDLSPYFNEISSAQKSDTAETTAFGATAKSFVVGFPDGSISLKGMWDGAVGAVDAYLSDAVGNSTDGVCSYGVGGPTFGARMRLLLSIGTEYETTVPVADVVSITGTISADGTIEPGQWLVVNSSLSTATTGAAIDNLGGTGNGAVAHLHVTANNRNGTAVVKVQHSTDNTTFVDLMTFTTIPTATTTSQRLAVTGAVNRYLRAVTTPAGSTGALTVSVGIARR